MPEAQGRAVAGARAGASRRLKSPRATPDRWLVVLTGLAASIPVIVSTARGLIAGWTPEGDRAVVAARAYDVFTGLSPLVGPWSSTSTTLDTPTFHPGPLLYWLLAIPAHLSAAAAFPLTIAAVNLGAVMGAVALANRRGGRPLMFVSAAAIALMCASLRSEALYDIWAPTAPLLVFVLLLFSSWSLACGEYRLLPLAVVSASFAIQCHFVFLLPCVALVAVGVLGLAAARRGDTRTGADHRSLRRWCLAGLATAVFCWSAPLADQVLDWAGSSRGEGNLVKLVDASQSREHPAGEKAGVYSVAWATGVPPWWLQAPPDATGRVFQIFRRPGIGTLASAALLLALLATTTFVGMRRGRRDVAAGGALALVSCAALAVVTASFPNTPSTIFSYSYTSWWAAPVGMWTWLIAGWSAATLWGAGLSRRAARSPSPRWAGAVGLAGVLAVAAVVAWGQGPNSKQAVLDATRPVVREVGAELPAPEAVRVNSGTIDFQAAVVYELRRRGARIGTKNFVQFGSGYELDDRRYEAVLDIRHGTAPPAGANAVARARLRSPPPNRFVFSVAR